MVGRYLSLTPVGLPSPPSKVDGLSPYYVGMLNIIGLALSALLLGVVLIGLMLWFFFLRR